MEGPVFCLCILVVGASALTSAGGDRRRFRTRQLGAETFFPVVTLNRAVISRHEPGVLGGSAANLGYGGERIVARGQHEHEAVGKQSDIPEILY